MAKLTNLFGGAGFDSSAVEPSEARDGTPLPAGTYTVEITGAELKELTKKNGQGLNLEFTVIDPQAHARRKVWALLCIVHENEQTQSIAQAQLSAICRAANIPVLQDTDELFGKILSVRTKIRPAQGEYAAKAEITGYEAVGVAAARPAPPPPPAAGGGAAPWKRKAA